MKEFDYVVVASPNELPLVQSILKQYQLDLNVRIIVTGVGGINVYRSLADIDRNARLLNIGFAGSPDIPVGAFLEIGKCNLSHKVDYKEPYFILDKDNPNVCHTLSDFGTSGEPGCVYDMELAFICAMGFHVQAIKMVSDKMNEDQYENTVEKTTKKGKKK